MKEGLMSLALATADAFYDNYFFWTWKIGPSQTGEIGAPLWSYQLGLRNGWIPKDPRAAKGKCVAVGVEAGEPREVTSRTFASWQTGVPSPIPEEVREKLAWPPQISGAQVPMEWLPTYTNTGAVKTLAPATFSGAPSQVTASVDGWWNDNDKDGGITTVKGCPYPDQYDGIFTTIPTAPCTGLAPTTT